VGTVDIEPPLVARLPARHSSLKPTAGSSASAINLLDDGICKHFFQALSDGV
jgi:hypothetical protein